MNPCRNRIRVATLRLHWWRGPCNLPLVWAFGGRLSDVEVDLFRFFLICKYIQRYIQVIIANWLCKVFLLDDFKNYLLRKCVCVSVWKVILQGWIWEVLFLHLNPCKKRYSNIYIYMYVYTCFTFLLKIFLQRSNGTYIQVYIFEQIFVYISLCI